MIFSQKLLQVGLLISVLLLAGCNDILGGAEFLGMRFQTKIPSTCPKSGTMWLGQSYTFEPAHKIGKLTDYRVFGYDNDPTKIGAIRCAGFCSEKEMPAIVDELSKLYPHLNLQKNNVLGCWQSDTKNLTEKSTGLFGAVRNNGLGEVIVYVMDLSKSCVAPMSFLINPDITFDLHITQHTKEGSSFAGLVPGMQHIGVGARMGSDKAGEIYEYEPKENEFGLHKFAVGLTPSTKTLYRIDGYKIMNDEASAQEFADRVMSVYEQRLGAKRYSQRDDPNFWMFSFDDGFLTVSIRAESSRYKVSINRVDLALSGWGQTEKANVGKHFFR